MDPHALLAQLDRELTAYAEGLATVSADQLWDAPVPSCPGWTVRDLTHHLIGVHQWVEGAVTGVRGSESGPNMPADDALVPAFDSSAGMLRALLDQDPQTPCWSFGENQSVGFWQRRQAHENAVHRWDLESALGMAPSLDPVLASDGIDEIVSMFWPRQIGLGRSAEPAEHVLLVALDTEQTWLLGNLAPVGTPVATLSGNAADVDLALWKRTPLDSPVLRWSGDQVAGSALLSLNLVP